MALKRSPSSRVDSIAIVPILVGVTLTVSVLAFVYFAAIVRRPDGSTGLSHFLLLSPNEMGDAVAGLFSSLTFVWIVVTVILQWTELRAQRNELALQRAELSELARLQGEQLKFIEIRAGLSAIDTGYALEQRVDLYFDQLFSSIQNLVSLMPQAFLEWNYEVTSSEGEISQHLVRVDLKRILEKSDELFLRFGSDCCYVFSTLNGIGIEHDWDEVRVSKISGPPRSAHHLEIQKMCDRIVSDLEKASPAMQARIIGSHIGVLEKWLGILVEDGKYWSFDLEEKLRDAT